MDFHKGRDDFMKISKAYSYVGKNIPDPPHRISSKVNSMGQPCNRFLFFDLKRCDAVRGVERIDIPEPVVLEK